VGWQESKPGVDPVHEGLNLLFVTKDHAALPVGGDGAQVDHLDVTDGLDDLAGLCGRDLAHDTPSTTSKLLNIHCTGLNGDVPERANPPHGSPRGLRGLYKAG
jgi:hypothetical protein